MLDESFDDKTAKPSAKARLAVGLNRFWTTLALWMHVIGSFTIWQILPEEQRYQPSWALDVIVYAWILALVGNLLSYVMKDYAQTILIIWHSGDDLQIQLRNKVLARSYGLSLILFSFAMGFFMSTEINSGGASYEDAVLFFGTALFISSVYPSYRLAWTVAPPPREDTFEDRPA